MATPTRASAPSPVLSIEPIDDAAEGEWQSYVAGHPEASAYHDYRWRGWVESAFGQRTRYLAARDGAGAIRGVLPLARLRSVPFGDFMVSLPYVNYGGPLADDPQAAAALAEAGAEAARDAGCSHFECRGVADLGLDWPTRTDKVAMVLELPDSPEALGKRIGSKVRSQIKRPQREGATVTEGGGELLDEFYGLFARNMRDLGTPVYSRRVFAELLERFPDEARIAVVRVAGVPAASGLVLRSGDRMEIPWASSDRRFNRIGVNMLLYWHVLGAAIESGCRTFDFGRSTVDGGTYRFKRQWGAEPVQLRWHYWLREGTEPPGLRPDNPKFDLAIRAWKRMPVWATRIVGPHLARGLP